MRYALAVLTHGDNADTLERTIRSFDRHVTHPPVARYLVQDGPGALPPFAPYPWVVQPLARQQGFCTATRELWKLVTHDEQRFDYVFWLEHDFDMLRTIPVERMAALLDSDDLLAQVSLMRGPANEREDNAGGVVADMRERGWTMLDDYSEEAGVGFLRHVAYFTTNPSLMTRAFMRDNPWPDYRRNCEGRMGLDLMHRGFSFAILGAGEPWVEHHGVRTGTHY